MENKQQKKDTQNKEEPLVYHTPGGEMPDAKSVDEDLKKHSEREKELKETEQKKAG